MSGLEETRNPADGCNNWQLVVQSLINSRRCTIIRRDSLYISPFIRAKVSSRHWVPLIHFAPPTSLCKLQQVRNESICSGQNLTRTRMRTHVQTTKKLSKTSTTLKVHSKASAISSFLGAALHFENIFKSKTTFRTPKPLLPRSSHLL